VVAVLALAGCRSADVLEAEGPGTQESTGPQSNDNTVPFHVVVDNTAEIVPPPPPPLVHGIFRGTARSHPFGHSKFFGTTEIDPFVFPNHQTVDAVFTYRNGDELHFSSVGIGIPDEFGNSDFSGDYTITGGTGRFKDATGGGTYAGTFTAATSSAHFTMDGVISDFGTVGNDNDEDAED
jgi:hypothetical protein